MVCFPNAKINIGLHILDKRSDGYHNIETVFYPAGLTDILELVEDKSLDNGMCELKVTGLHLLGSAEENLVNKTYKLLNRKMILPGVRIHLHKIIPQGSGLGGGSSDAAFMLQLLNKNFRLGLEAEEMEEMISEIGSDCPFFIRNKPVFAFERGNRLSGISLNLRGHFLLIVVPDIRVNTKDAYGMISPLKQAQALQDVVKQPPETWKERVTNEFEKSVFTKFPEIRQIKEKMYNLGAIYASMSGSGSAVYGLFQESPPIAEVFNKYFCWQGKLA